MTPDTISFTFAALIAMGGVIGFVRRGSVASLAAGFAFGAILAFGAYQTSVNPDNYYLTLATSIVLASLMAYRFVNTGKFMPAGMITLMSLGMIARFTILRSSTS